MAGSPMSEQKGRFRNEPRTHELALFVSSYFSRETRRGGGGGGLSRWQYIRSALSGPSGPPGPSGPSGPSSDTRYAVRTSGSCNDFTTTVSSVMLVLCNVRPPACRLEEKRREKKILLVLLEARAAISLHFNMHYLHNHYCNYISILSYVPVTSRNK